jgi:FMN phosphatase YigB (HAD superfamily)
MQTSRPVVLLDIDDTLFDTALFIQSGLLEHKVYEEVRQVLENLNTFATLGIFSKGEVQFQKTKLRETDLVKFFEEKNIHIFDDKNINLVQTVNKYKGSKIFLVDDRLEVLSSAKKNTKQIFTIWMKRGRYAQSQKEIPGFFPDARVENLLEVVKIVKSNL